MCAMDLNTDIALSEYNARMNQPTPKMAVDFSQPELFFQLKMAAYYKDHYFRGAQPVNSIQDSAIFGVSSRRLWNKQLVRPRFQLQANTILSWKVYNIIGS